MTRLKEYIPQTTYHRQFRQNTAMMTVSALWSRYMNKEIKIRRLTSLECWRLMGFTDEDYKKAASVVSETQLYKQAGNSIVVDVLMAIFKEML